MQLAVSKSQSWYFAGPLEICHKFKNIQPMKILTTELVAKGALSLHSWLSAVKLGSGRSERMLFWADNNIRRGGRVHFAFVQRAKRMGKTTDGQEPTTWGKDDNKNRRSNVFSQTKRPGTTTKGKTGYIWQTRKKQTNRQTTNRQTMHWIFRSCNKQHKSSLVQNFCSRKCTPSFPGEQTNTLTKTNKHFDKNKQTIWQIHTYRWQII